MSKHLNFMKQHPNLFCIDIYDENLDSQDLLQICQIAINNNIQYISSIPKYIDKIWSWIEKHSIQISGIINDVEEKLTDKDLLIQTKNLSKSGVKQIEYIIPYNISLDKLQNNLNVIGLNASKNCKIILSTDFSEELNIKELKKKVQKLLSMSFINGFKTSSGLQTNYPNPNINTFNIILDEIKDMDNPNFILKVNTSIYDNKKNPLYESLFRLSSVVIGREETLKSLILCQNQNLFKSKKILI